MSAGILGKPVTICVIPFRNPHALDRECWTVMENIRIQRKDNGKTFQLEKRKYIIKNFSFIIL